MSQYPLRSISEWRERDRAAFERMHHAMSAGNRAAAEVVVSILSPDEGVRIEVGGDSRLRSISIDREAYREYDADQLGDLIATSLKVARREVKRQQFEIFQDKFIDRERRK